MKTWDQLEHKLIQFVEDVVAIAETREIEKVELDIGDRDEGGIDSYMDCTLDVCGRHVRVIRRRTGWRTYHVEASRPDVRIYGKIRFSYHRDERDDLTIYRSIHHDGFFEAFDAVVVGLRLMRPSG